MALVEVFHLVASELPINPSATPDIPQGSVVVLDANGLVSVAAATITGANTTVNNPIGLAGDSRSQGTTSYTPESGSALNTHTDDDGDGLIEDVALANWGDVDASAGALVMGAWGEQERFTQNRIADNYNEVFSSGKMTVYHGGGEFWTDQYDPDVTTWGAAQILDNLFAGANAGMWTNNTLATYNSGVCLAEPQALPSGVPGTDVQGSISWGTYIHLRLWH